MIRALIPCPSRMLAVVLRHTCEVTQSKPAFVLASAGGLPPVPPDGVLASCAWRRAGDTTYALEGFVPAAGGLRFLEWRTLGSGWTTPPCAANACPAR